MTPRKTNGRGPVLWRRLKRITRLAIRPDRGESFREMRWVMKRSVRRSSRSDGQRLTVGIGFEYPKRKMLRKLYPEKNWVFLPMGNGIINARTVLDTVEQCECWVWSFRDSVLSGTDIHEKWASVTRVEDGFVRGKGLGNARNPSWSYCVDETGIYFDGMRPSDLETICQTHRFSKEELSRARAMMRVLRDKRLSKYNLEQQQIGDNMFGCEPQNVVLVLGQVEDDQSILQNDSKIRTNRTLLEHAITHRDGRLVFYKPHPDVESGRRPARSTFEGLEGQFTQIGMQYALPDLLDHVDTVFTISSLGGFEALLRGCNVHTLGRPFYAGWGLTTDALTFPRRTRKLTLEQLFAASYLLYPKYFDPHTGRKLTLEDVVQCLS